MKVRQQMKVSQVFDSSIQGVVTQFAMDIPYFALADTSKHSTYKQIYNMQGLNPNADSKMNAPALGIIHYEGGAEWKGNVLDLDKNPQTPQEYLRGMKTYSGGHTKTLYDKQSGIERMLVEMDTNAVSANASLRWKDLFGSAMKNLILQINSHIKTVTKLGIDSTYIGMIGSKFTKPEELTPIQNMYRRSGRLRTHYTMVAKNMNGGVSSVAGYNVRQKPSLILPFDSFNSFTDAMVSTSTQYTRTSIESYIYNAPVQEVRGTVLIPTDDRMTYTNGNYKYANPLGGDDLDVKIGLISDPVVLANDSTEDPTTLSMFTDVDIFICKQDGTKVDAGQTVLKRGQPINLLQFVRASADGATKLNANLSGQINNGAYVTTVQRDVITNDTDKCKYKVRLHTMFSDVRIPEMVTCAMKSGETFDSNIVFDGTTGAITTPVAGTDEFENLNVIEPVGDSEASYNMAFYSQGHVLGYVPEPMSIKTIGIGDNVRLPSELEPNSFNKAIGIGEMSTGVYNNMPAYTFNFSKYLVRKANAGDDYSALMRQYSDSGMTVYSLVAEFCPYMMTHVNQKFNSFDQEVRVDIKAFCSTCDPQKGIKVVLDKTEDPCSDADADTLDPLFQITT